MRYEQDTKFYRICVICRKKIDAKKEMICPECISKSMLYNDVCLKRRQDAFDDAYCLFYYGRDMRRVMYDIKVNLNTELLFPLAGLLAEKTRELQVDLITYIPGYPARRIIKGFNPAEVMAREISRIRKTPAGKTLARKAELLPKQQKMLTRAERFESVQAMYRAVSDPGVRGKVILLVDDVLTTGATLSCCSRILKDNGAAAVYAAVAASGRDH